jgi:hypothetical protein
MKKKTEITLDNTLRYLLVSLRVHGVRIMAIEFIHRGKKWRVDTPEEALAFRKKLEQEDHNEVAYDPNLATELLYEKNKWTPDRFTDLINNIGPRQMNLLRVLVATPNWSIEVNELAEKLKLRSPNSLPGILSGLSKQVRKMGLEPYDLYRDRIDWTEGDRSRSLQIDRGFQLAALDAGWKPFKGKVKSKK